MKKGDSMDNATNTATNTTTNTATTEPVTQKETAQVSFEYDPKLEALLDLSLPVAIELGRTNLPLREILALQRGSVVEFEKLASEPVDILINGKKMAEGEVVVIEKHFGIRITSLVDASERVKGLGK